MAERDEEREELIERSSLGTSGAQQPRRGTPRSQVEAARRIVYRDTRDEGQLQGMSSFLFSEQEMDALCAMGQQRRYPAGDRLFGQGDNSDHVILIRRGKVKISSVSPAGYEAVLAVRSAGEIVGEISVLDGRPRSASVLALDDVDGVLVSGDRFRAFLRANPDTMLTLLSHVAARLREADRHRVEFGAYDVASRVARLLLDLADRFGSPAPDGSGTTITVALSQHDLAGATGSSREAVARVLRRLRESGGIVTERRRITVLRPDLLREVAESPADRS